MTRHFNTHTETMDMSLWLKIMKEHGQLVSFAKNDTFCRSGEACRALGIVTEGYFMYNVPCAAAEGENKIIIGGFAFPGALVGDYPFCMYNETCKFSIVAGSDAKAYVIDATQLPALYETSMELQRFGRESMEAAYRSLNHRYFDLYCKTPKERYLDLISRHPQILQQITLAQLASYLQISPVHLSRIRREILRD